MSKVAIQGNASGTGTFTIAAPNSSTDRTLTLPDETGTIVTSSSSVLNGSAKAWVNFNGSTATIRAAHNVSSITRNGAGDYSINFTTALADANYAIAGATQGIAGLFSINNTTGLTTGYARVRVTNSTTAASADVTQATFVAFR